MMKRQGNASAAMPCLIPWKKWPINPAVTFPDTKLFIEGVKNLELFFIIDPNMTETGQLADYVLPACTFLEETGIGGFP